MARTPPSRPQRPATPGPGDKSAERRKRSAWRPAATKPEDRGPARLGELLVGMQAQIGARSGAYMSQEDWRALVGERIASRTRVGKRYRGSLTIKVASSAWCNELSFLKSDLLARLQRAGHEVDDLRFRVDQSEAPRRSMNPFARKAMEQRQAAAKPRSLDYEDLPAELRDRLAKVEDPVLRAAIADAARWSLGPQRGAAAERRERTPAQGQGRSSRSAAPSRPAPPQKRRK